MTDDNSLYAEAKQPDEFRTESPLRAFAEYQEFGGWLIAKGFRPSLQHLVRYLAAMESREGYRMVQILEAATGVPTMIFRTTARAPLDMVSDVFKPSEIARGNACIDKSPTPTPMPEEKHIAVMTLRGLDAERTHWSAASWNGNPEDLMDRLKVMTYSGARQRFLEQESAEDMRHYWRTASVASVLRLIDMLGVWDELSLADPISYDELAKAIGHEPNALCLHHHSAKREEVTSESPVDTLERMAEELADDLNLDVDRESFAVARAHVEQMVEWPEDVPNDLREHAFRFVAERLGELPHNIEPRLNAYKKRFLNPKTTQISHTRFGPQVYFLFGGHYSINAIREATEAWKLVQTLYEPQSKGDDPLNPQHYNGRECADIGERLSANGYQMLKYCWRLGKKDDPCQELGKALWYLDSEAALMAIKGHPNSRSANRRGITGDTDQWVYARLHGQSEFTRKVALFLWDGYSTDTLDKLKAMIADHKATLDCGHGLAI